jgi:hypothetical protein
MEKRKRLPHISTPTAVETNDVDTANTFAEHKKDTPQNRDEKSYEEGMA